MTVTVVNQDSVLERARELVKGAQKRIWITSPWITGRAANALLRDVLPRVQKDDLDVRVVYRVKEPSDLEITDFEALKSLEDAGCQVRYSTRLHAKILLSDEASGIVSSSNLTETAGYSVSIPAEWKNEEVGIALDGEKQALASLAAEFEAIWEASHVVDAGTLGITMDFPSVNEFNFVAIREVRAGEYVSAAAPDGSTVVGRIAGIIAYNRSFPHMNEAMWLTQGYTGATERRRAEIPDLQSLFSYPSKERGFLVTKTFFEPESVFQIAQVEVLKNHREGRLRAPSVPVAPGSDVSRASPELLRELLGEGDIDVGTVLHHPEVPVALRGDEIVSKHLAILGMTGSGKSNALKVMLREFLTESAYEDVSVVVIDPHGEYVPIRETLAPGAKVVDVELRRAVLEEETLRALVRPQRWDGDIPSIVWQVAEGLAQGADLAAFLAALESESESHGGALGERLKRVVERGRGETDLCLFPEDGARIVTSEGEPEPMDDPGLYVLDLRPTAEFEQRSVKAAAVMSHVFKRSKTSNGDYRALVAIDEAQNFAPEQQTGWLTKARPSQDAAFAIASEGRKFGVGLIVATQRPARVNKDILSQCNSHVIFRVANVEDLNAIAGSFEAATRTLLQELPGFDTGVCVAGGTTIGLVTRIEVPLFEAEAGG